VFFTKHLFELHKLQGDTTCYDIHDFYRSLHPPLLYRRYKCSRAEIADFEDFCLLIVLEKRIALVADVKHISVYFVSLILSRIVLRPFNVPITVVSESILKGMRKRFPLLLFAVCVCVKQ
jgi:hypothetical protein